MPGRKKRVIKPKLVLDDWQEAVLHTSGNICLRSGRQVGKSTVVSIKAAEYALNNPGSTILVIAHVERQSYLMFEKIFSYLHDHYRRRICSGKKKPTKSKLTLTNGSVIYSLPTGLSGHGIRGYTVDLLIADEAAFIPQDVWAAVTPMLAVTGGKMVLLSTPFGKRGYFYDCFNDPSFTKFHVSSEDCPRMDKENLKIQKDRLTKVQYAQEYLGEFVDELQQFFPSELIKKCMVPKDFYHLKQSGHNFLGVDVARRGGDETVMLTVNRRKHGSLYVMHMKIEDENLLTDTVADIKELDREYGYKRIYIDDAGLGVGVFDLLLADVQTSRKVVPINNASRTISKDRKRKKKLLKEDLYTNLKSLMEQGIIYLPEDDRVYASLQSVQFEYKHDQIRIFGKYTHIAEALIRAVWCHKDKSLNIYMY